MTATSTPLPEFGMQQQNPLIIFIDYLYNVYGMYVYTLYDCIIQVHVLMLDMECVVRQDTVLDIQQIVSVIVTAMHVAIVAMMQKVFAPIVSRVQPIQQICTILYLVLVQFSV